MTKTERARRAEAALREAYPDAVCSLETGSAFQLLVATRLSAQCTDARVNLVTPELFSRWPDAAAMALAEVPEVEAVIRSCGFYHQKARDIVAAAQMLLAEYGGAVPDEIEQLVRLPGVGRKTANLVVGDIYGKPAVVADTHLIRISNRLGLVKTKDPAKVEKELRALLDPAESNAFCHRCVLHGRAVCDARKPRCAACCMAAFCASAAT